MNRKRKDGTTWSKRRRTCKACDIITSSRQRTGPNRDAYLAYQAEYTKNHRKDRRAKALKKLAWFDSLKSDPCEDCGNRFPPECMDFDHIDPATKNFTLSTRVVCGDGFAEKMKKEAIEEIAKCRLICANCHRIRTAKQFGRGLIDKPDHMTPIKRDKPMR